MASPLNSIMTKLTASFVILVLIIAGLTYLYTYGASTEAIKESTQKELLALASVTAADLNGDEIAKLEPGMEAKVIYLMNSEQLSKMAQSDAEIVKIYTMRKNGDTFEYVIDSGYNTGHRNLKIGDLEKNPTEAMKKAVNSSQVEQEFIHHEWGEVFSGYAPIRNASGVTIGIVGVDMNAESVQARMDFVGQTIYIILIVGIGVAGLIIAIFSRTMIRDIHILID